MYFRLKQPWRLRGYENELLLLERAGTPGAPYKLTAPLYELLSQCDGETPAKFTSVQHEALERYISMGIVEKTEEMLPIAPEQAYRHIKNRRVPTAMWSITGRCNMRCVHCFMASGSETPIHEFSCSQAEALTAQLAQCGVKNIYLTGGEPLLHPDFERILQCIHQNGLDVTRLYTNGMLLNKKTLTSFEALGMRPEIVLSFDGLGTHDWMRGVKGAQAAAERAIELAVKSGNEVRAAVNVNSQTRDGLIETSRFLYGLGVRSIFFVRTGESPRWSSTNSKTISMDDFCRMAVELTGALLYENRHGLALKFFGGITLAPSATRVNTDIAYKVYAGEAAAESAWCQKVACTLFIASDGRVLPCDAFEGASLASGTFFEDNNVFTRPLCDILTDSEYSRALALRACDVIASNAQCANCAWREKCHGGACRVCAILSGAQKTGQYDISGDMRGISPISCTMFKGGYYDEILSLLDKP